MKKTPYRFYNKKYNLVGMFIVLSLVTVMCRKVEKQNKFERLDSQIADVDKKISQTRDIRNAPVPNRLRATQQRYNTSMDSLQTVGDSLDKYAMYNDSVMAHAFDKYAVRVGRDFQLSQFLLPTDISVFQRHIAKLDTMDFVTENARQRILRGLGSLNDLSYFLEIIDYDSVNEQLTNKLAWDFIPDSTDTDTANLIAVLNFDTLQQNGITINNAMRREQQLLNMAYTKSDTNTYAPEIDSVYQDPKYNYNDSVLRANQKVAERATLEEDSLLEYQSGLKAKRDSLVRERDELIR